LVLIHQIDLEIHGLLLDLGLHPVQYDQQDLTHLSDHPGQEYRSVLADQDHP
jgi:hypothetical protein